MRDNILISIFTGVLAYSAIILINLFLQQPLPQVFYNGLLGLIIVGGGTFIITILLEKFDLDALINKIGDSKENNENEGNQTDEGQSDQNQGGDSEDEFSPMDPTVLEVEEEESN